jgi:hypothetical protein
MKTAISISIVVSLMLLVSAAVWEGVTDVVSTGDLPGNYSVATNSFPRNSIVDITNLENGKMVRAIVVSGLETTGLLATLSRNAASSLELRGNSTCRIRITQPSDDIAFSRFKLGPIAAPPAAALEADTLSEKNASEGTDRDEAQNLTAAVIGADAAQKTDYPIAAAVVAEEPVLKSTEIITAQTAPETVTEITTVTTRTRTTQAPATAVTGTTPQDTQAPVQAVAEPVVEPIVEPIFIEEKTVETITETRVVEIIPQNTAVQVPVLAATELIIEPEMIPQDTAVQASVQPVTEQPVYAVAEPVAVAVEEPVTPAGSTANVGIIPSEERPPNAANRFVIAPENLAPPLKKNNVSNAPASSPAKSDFSPFQVPLISRLEQGKCYVQVAAYQQVEHVEDELSRIGTTYPLAVQNVGSDTNPMFRILLGPLNQGESGAMLQRFKSIGYSDAFIRYN